MSETVTLWAKKNYDDPIGADGSGMTMTAFHVGQNCDALSDAPMRTDVLTHLMSSSAVNYWKNTKMMARVMRKASKPEKTFSG